MGATVNITVSGSDDLIASLRGLGKEFSDFSDELAKTGEYLVDWFPGIPFGTEGGIYGEPWAPLSYSYAKRKDNSHRGAGILVASGEMQRSFYSQTGDGYVEIGNNTDYFKYHQQGTSKMPARVSMKISSANAPAIKKIFTDGTQEKIQALGF